MGFWPSESLGKSKGESNLSPSDFSPAFPGCFASGLAAFSRRVRSTTAASLSLHEVQEAGRQPREKSPGSGVQGDEPPMTAYGGILMGGEFSRNKQRPKDLRRLRLRKKKSPASYLFIRA